MATQMTFAGVVEQISSRIKDVSPQELLVCKPLVNVLKTMDLGAIHQNTPALFITNVGTSETSVVESGECDVTLNVVAYLLSVNTDVETVQSILTRLSFIIPNQRWKIPNCFPAQNLETLDYHGLSKDDKPLMSNWRTGISVLSYAYVSINTQKLPGINTQKLPVEGSKI